MNVDIGGIVSRSFQLVTRNRVFWALGLALALMTLPITYHSSPALRPLTPTGAGATAAATSGQILLFTCIGLLLYIAFFIVRAAFEAGTISATERAERGSVPSFREAWQAGTTKMWPVLGINLLLVLIYLLFFAIMAILAVLMVGGAVGSFFSAIASGSQPSGNSGAAFSAIGASIGLLFACICGLILIAIPLSVALGAIVQFGERAIVLDNQGVGQSWSTGWKLLKQNVGPVILLWLIQTGISIVAAIPIYIIGLIIALGSLSIASSGDAISVFFGIVIGIISWLVFGLIFALPLAWFSAMWTMFYESVTGRMPAGPGQPAIYPGGAGAYPGPGQYPGGYAPPPPPAGGGYTVYSPPSGPPATGGYTVPGQYAGGYVPPPTPGDLPLAGNEGRARQEPEGEQEI